MKYKLILSGFILVMFLGNSAIGQSQEYFLSSLNSNLMACKMTLSSSKTDYVAISERTVNSFSKYYTHCQKHDNQKQFFQTLNHSLKNSKIICDPFEGGFKAIKNQLIMNTQSNKEMYRGLLNQFSLGLRKADNFLNAKAKKELLKLITEIKLKI